MVDPRVQKVAERLGISVELIGFAPGSLVEGGVLYSNPSMIYELQGFAEEDNGRFWEAYDNDKFARAAKACAETIISHVSQ